MRGQMNSQFYAGQINTLLAGGTFGEYSGPAGAKQLMKDIQGGKISSITATGPDGEAVPLDSTVANNIILHGTGEIRAQSGSDEAKKKIRVADAKTNISQYNSDMDNGIKVPDEEIDTLVQVALESGNPKLILDAYRLQRKQKLLFGERTVRVDEDGNAVKDKDGNVIFDQGFMYKSLKEQENNINSLRRKSQNGTISDTERELLKIMEDAYKTQGNMEIDDVSSLGMFSTPYISFNEVTPEQYSNWVALRRQQAEEYYVRTGRRVPPFTKAELKEMGNQAFVEGDIGLIAAIANGAGPDAEAIFNSMGNDNNSGVSAIVGLHYASGTDGQAVAGAIMEGIQIIQDTPEKYITLKKFKILADEGVPRGGWNEGNYSFDVFGGNTKSEKAAKEAVYYAYIQLMQSQGKPIDLDNIDADVYGQAYDGVMGTVLKTPGSNSITSGRGTFQSPYSGGDPEVQQILVDQFFDEMKPEDYPQIPGWILNAAKSGDGDFVFSPLPNGTMGIWNTKTNQFVNNRGFDVNNDSVASDEVFTFTFATPSESTYDAYDGDVVPEGAKEANPASTAWDNVFGDD